MGPLNKKELNADYLIPRTLFCGFYGPLPDRNVNLFLTDVIRISSGTFGVVYKANLYIYPHKKKDIENKELITTGPQTPTIVAVKRVLQDKKYKNRELEITRILDHKNIISLKYYFKMINGESCYLGLILEYLPYTFYSLTRENFMSSKRFTEMELKSFAYQLLSAMDYIHKMEICHRDIKPHNILVDESKQIIKVCDFGSAKRLVPTESNVAYICSRHYRAPELIMGNSIYTTSIDIWSCGCVLSEAVIGRTLFLGKNSADQLAQIGNVFGITDLDILKSMVTNDNKQCPLLLKCSQNLSKYINCKYFGFQKLLEQMLTFSPSLRSSSSQLLSSEYLSDFPH